MRDGLSMNGTQSKYIKEIENKYHNEGDNPPQLKEKTMRTLLKELNKQANMWDATRQDFEDKGDLEGMRMSEKEYEKLQEQMYDIEAHLNEYEEEWDLSLDFEDEGWYSTSIEEEW